MYALRLVCLSLLLTHLVAGATPEEGKKALSAEVDELFHPISGKAFPGAAVSVIMNGKVIHEKAYGFSNIELKVPNSTSTKFRLGSVTKQFTAMAILQLHEKGLLDETDFLSKYFPDHPHGKRIQLRHLLTHTSGLPDFISFEQTREVELLFEPGSRVNYSNPAFWILGRIVERVSGMSYEAYLREHIFEPLEMDDSGFDHPEMILAGRAAGYRYDPTSNTLLNAPIPDMEGAFSAGGLYSTVEDMVKWDRALYSDRLISEKTRSMMFGATRLSDGRESVCGMGWLVFERKGLREISHGGDIDGFNSSIIRFPERKFSVIVLSNVGMWPPNNVLPSAADLAKEIARIYLGDQVLSERNPIGVDPEIFDSLAGTYQVDAPPSILQNTGEVFIVTREGERLFGESKRGKLELLPETEVTYFAREFPVTITFLRDSENRVDKVLFSLLGVREFVGHKK